MASLLVILIISGCVAYQYLKGTFVKSFTAIIVAICASVVAFGYFESLAEVFIRRGATSRAAWAQTFCFILLFVLAFVILQTIAGQLIRRTVVLGLQAERIGRPVCGIFLGLILSGFLLTALAMAPLTSRYPYQRFDQARPDPEKPDRALLNADGFATGWFNLVSNGSLSGKRSFTALHPAFLDQLFLNRQAIDENISIITSTKTLEIPKKNAAWHAPEGLKDSSGEPVLPKSGCNLTIVRVGINKKAIKKAGTFTLSQLRLVCSRRADNTDLLAEKGKNIYPIGYLRAADQLKIKQLNDKIEIEPTGFDGAVRWIDFAFYVPNELSPLLVEFKQNSVAMVPPLVTAEKAPPTVPFIQLAECATDLAELQPVASAKIYGVELAAGTKFLNELTLEVSNTDQWQSFQTAQSIKPAQFENGRINYVRAELKIEKPAQDKSEDTKKKSWKEREAIKTMFKPLNGYKLLSLKCNSPSTGMAIKGKQLPTLVELSGLVHQPVGIIASGKIGGQTRYEVDYCSVTAEDTTDGITIAKDGSVEQPFPPTVWLTEQAQTISEFYVLYLVKSGRNAIITSVQPADSQETAGFKLHEGFFVR